MSFNVEQFPSVNIHLFDELDDAAMDSATEFEDRLADLGITVPDYVLEAIYNQMLTAAINSVQGEDNA